MGPGGGCSDSNLVCLWVSSGSERSCENLWLPLLAVLQKELFAGLFSGGLVPERLTGNTKRIALLFTDLKEILLWMGPCRPPPL